MSLSKALRDSPDEVLVGHVVPRVPLLDVVLVAVHPALPVLPASLPEREVRPEEGPDDGPPENGHRICAHQLPNEGHGAVFEHADDVLAHQVEVLLAHVRHLVLHLAGIVDNDEGGLLLLGFLVELVVFVDAVEFLQEGLVRRPRKTTKMENDLIPKWTISDNLKVCCILKILVMGSVKPHKTANETSIYKYNFFALKILIICSLIFIITLGHNNA